MSGHYLVTIAPPTPNGDLHVGHLSGPYLAADVFARSRRQAGDEAILLGYADDYQSYMVRRARERNEDALVLARRNAQEIAETLALAGIELDHFMSASASDHFAQSVARFAQAAHDSGSFVTETKPAPYCEHCQVHGYEAFARGTCNVCGTSTDASQCEHCASAPDLTGVSDLRCILCDRAMTFRDTPRLCLDLNRFRPFLRDLHARTKGRPQLGEYIENVLNLPDLTWPVDRPDEHGIDIEGFGRIHTWFSGIAGYHAAYARFADEHGGATRKAEEVFTDPSTELVHFLGFDCSFSHAVVYPALLEAAGYTTSVRWFTNAFLKLDGQDFSTSRGHAVWVRELLQEASVDAVRLYVALVAPERAAGNFSRADFRSFCKGSMAWLEGVAKGAITLPGAARNPLRGELVQQVRGLREAWAHAASVEHFSMRGMAEAAEELRELALAQARTGSAQSARLVAELAEMLEPLAPTLARKLHAVLVQDQAPSRRDQGGLLAAYEEE